MSEVAKQTYETALKIRDKTNEIIQLYERVTTKLLVGGEVVAFTQTQKQIVIQYFRTLKTELKALVDELP